MYQDTGNQFDTITAMERTYKDFEQKRDAAWAHGNELDARCEELDRAIAGLRQVMSADAGGAIPPIDFTGCRNMGDRLHRIAMVTGGTVDIAKALDLLERSWPTDAKRDTLRSDISRWIRRHPADWEKVAPRVYRYLRYEEAEAGAQDEH